MWSLSTQLILVLQEIICLQKQLKSIRGPRVFRLIRMELHTEFQVMFLTMLSISGNQ